MKSPETSELSSSRNSVVHSARDCMMEKKNSSIMLQYFTMYHLNIVNNLIQSVQCSVDDHQPVS